MEPTSLLGEYAEIKNRHEVTGMLALTHPECQYEDAASGLLVAGHAELRRYHEHLFAAVPDYRASMDGIAGAGDAAVAWGRLGGTLSRPLFGYGRAGDRFEVAAVFVCTLRDGLLYRERAHIGLASLHEQLAPPTQRFIDAFTAAWSRPTGPGLSALFTEDAVVQHPGMSKPVRGRDAICAYFDAVLTVRPGMHLQPEATATAPGTVFVHWRMNDATSSWEGIDRFRLRGDLAEYGLAHFDSATAQPSGAAQ